MLPMDLGETRRHRRSVVGVLAAVTVLVACDRGSRAAPPPAPPAAVAAPAAPSPTAPATAAQASATVTPKTQTPEAARTLSRAFASTARAVRPSVVRIDVERPAPRLVRGPRRQAPDQDPFGNLPAPFRRFFDFGEMPDFSDGPLPGPMSGTGSGFLIDTKGHILTNSHVVESGGKLKVTLHDGQEISATVVGKDSRTDVALLRLEKVPANLVAARLGDSSKLEVGEWVLAVGSPLGLEQTVTAGIISSKGKVGRNVQMSGDRVREYIQTDAKINPGNSGGPLVNLDGEVVGVNTLIRVGAGGAYGFAVPINEAYRVGQMLLTEGRVKYPYLGVNVQDVEALAPAQREQLGKGAPEKGAFVGSVVPGSPAAKVGIKQGDVIVEMDDRPVYGARDVVDQVSTRGIGADVRVTVVRDGSRRSLKTKLAEAPSEEAAPAEAGPLGLGLQNLTPPLAQSLGLPPDSRGVVISDVAPGSPAQSARLTPGDVILEIDRRPVASAEEAAAALRSPRPGGHLLRVRGPQGTRYVTLEPR